MTFTRAIGLACNKVILAIVRVLALSKIHPNVLTFIGLLINIGAAVLLATGRFRAAGWVIIGAGVFDMVDGRVARETNRVTRFGGFFDSVLDRYSDLALLIGLLVWYGTINRPLYVVLTAIAMTGSVMVSYTRARAENSIPTCKVGFMERPERVVLFIIGALFDRMAPVLWVTAVLSNLTVVQRMVFTWQEAKRLEDAQLRPAGARAKTSQASSLPLAQLDFVRQIHLFPGGVARIRETVTNLAGMDRPLAWQQHVTLGDPFIEPGVTRLSMTVGRSITYPLELSEHQPYKVWAEFAWPDAPHKDGSTIDLSTMPGLSRSGGVTGHLVNEDRERAHFIAWNPKLDVGIGYAWRRADFPWVSLWEENRSRDNPPWNGRTITRGIEFGVSAFAESRRSMIERGTLFGTPVYRWLAAGARIEVEYIAFVLPPGAPATPPA